MPVNPSGNATVSLRVDAEITAKFDQWIEDSKYDSRSAAIRSYMRRQVQSPGDREEPNDPELAEAWRNLKAKSSSSNWIRRTKAHAELAQSHQIPQTEVFPELVRPLVRRGYIGMSSDPTGRNTSYRIRE